LNERAQIDRILPWAAAVVWLVTAIRAVAAAIDAVHHASLLPGGSLLSLLIATAAVMTASVGGLIAGKTGNVVGWLLAAAGLELSFGIAAAMSSLVFCDTGAPSTVWPAVLGVTAWWAFLGTAVGLFPSGRWGRGRTGVAGVAGTGLVWAGMVTATLSAAFGSASAREAAGPCAVSRAASPAVTVGAILLGAGFALIAVVGILRVARAGRDERRQLAPVAGTAGALCLVVVAAVVLEPWARPLSGDAPWVVAAWIVAGLGIPLAAAVSVIRYRTFGIYRLIAFMTDYRLWTVGLAAAGVAAAVGIVWGVTTLAGIGDQPVAVAIATLAAAGAIVPLWRRRQSIVDARFGQHQPDPATTLASIDVRALDGDAEPVRGPVFDLLAPFAPIVVVEGEAGMRLAIGTEDPEIGRHTFVHRAYDMGAMRRAIDLLELEGGVPLWGRTVLDVGANIGVSIVPLLRLFGAERGIAVEPAPQLLELLRLNLTLNDLAERVQVLPMALSDRDGSMELALSPENAGDHRLRVPGTEADAVETRATVDVPVRRLDALVEEGAIDAASLGLIWLDVQGHEGHVMAGAPGVLASAVPVVTEFWPEALDRAGGLEMFRDAVRSSYSRVIDVRAAQASGAAQVLPTSRLDELAERYAGPTDFTDLLLLP
jgi:FkbM family methyltransferase